MHSWLGSTVEDSEQFRMLDSFPKQLMSVNTIEPTPIPKTEPVVPAALPVESEIQSRMMPSRKITAK